MLGKEGQKVVLSRNITADSRLKSDITRLNVGNLTVLARIRPRAARGVTYMATDFKLRNLTTGKSLLLVTSNFRGLPY